MWKVEPGRVGPVDGGFSLRCTIVDMNPSGARIRCSQDVNLPLYVRLVDRAQEIAYEAELVWSSAPEFGLKFLRREFV
jgi:hypothetical protein